MKPKLTLAAGLAFALFATAALAHPKLLVAIPAADSTAVSRMTRTVQLKFSEALVAKLCTVAITDVGGRPVATMPVMMTKGDKAGLTVALRGGLAPGVYTVAWHAVSVDTHAVDGKFSFTVS